MLSKLFSPLTTAAPIGVAIRDAVVAVGVLLTTLGTLGLLSAEQRDAVQHWITTVSDPSVIAAVGVLLGLGMSIYRQVTKSMTDKAAEVAKEVDAKVPKDDTVTVKSPSLSTPIKVAAK